MKLDSKPFIRKRPATRKIRVLVLKDELGHQFVVVKSGNGEISVPVQTAVPVSSLPKADFVVVKEDELAPFHVYSFSEIRQMGGIDALERVWEFQQVEN